MQPKTLSSLNAFASIWCVIENILLAAAAEGLGCAVRIPTGREQEYVSERVHAPENYEMPCYIAIGYPADNAVSIEQEKVNIEDKIHYNGW
jgi:nitroreductase